MLYTVIMRGRGGETFTSQVLRPDESEALLHAVGLWRPSGPVVCVELVGADVQDLPALASDLLRVTPMNGLKNVWYFYGALHEEMIDGQIVATA
jgi:hypothetical protein